MNTTTDGTTDGQAAGLRDAIGSRLAGFRGELAAMCDGLGRDPKTVKLVAVSKTQPAECVRAAVAAGIEDFGENRVQEAAAKLPQIAPRPVWHMVGHLQTNKAARAAELFDWVQSVDSVRLAQALGRGAERAGRVLNVLVQVNTTGEKQKSGCAPEDLAAVIEAVAGDSALRLHGLMTIGPLSMTEDDTRRAFETAAGLRESWRDRLGIDAMAVLSMGMSGDWRWALEYGADWVRLGTAIFGARGGAAA